MFNSKTSSNHNFLHAPEGLDAKNVFYMYIFLSVIEISVEINGIQNFFLVQGLRFSLKLLLALTIFIRK